MPYHSSLPIPQHTLKSGKMLYLFQSNHSTTITQSYTTANVIQYFNKLTSNSTNLSRNKTKQKVPNKINTTNQNYLLRHEMAGPCLDWEGARCRGLCDYLDQEGVGCLDYLDGWELKSDNSTIAEEETLENHRDGFLE